MSKIIIHNNSRLRNSDAVDLVARVIRKGFISGENQYCFCTTYKLHAHTPDIIVLAEKTRGDTHTFKVEEDENQSKS
jgi:hypothetical protein